MVNGVNGTSRELTLALSGHVEETYIAYYALARGKPVSRATRACAVNKHKQYTFSYRSCTYDKCSANKYLQREE